MQRQAPALEAALGQLQAAQLHRARITVAHRAASARRLTLADGRELIDFSSNDYLGLARHPALAAAMARSAREAGAGSGASHLVTGHGTEHARLEEELAAFTGRERALLFSTGYMANLAVMGTLAGRSERVLLDRLCHASLIDGARLSGAKVVRFRHADGGAAASALGAGPGRTAVLATDGVFSMDGDLAPLPELAACARAHDAWLLVDDAHGLGVIGEHGGGVLEHYALGSEAVPILIGTLGKAFGSFGAFVAGSAALIELLIQKARPYLYTTALPEPVAAATRAALVLIREESGRRRHLVTLVRRFRAAAQAAGVPLLPSQTAIQPVLLGSAGAALAAQRALAAAGYWVVAIRPPTVPAGSARLRVTLSATHSEAQVEGLAQELGRTCAELRNV